MANVLLCETRPRMSNRRSLGQKMLRKGRSAIGVLSAGQGAKGASSCLMECGRVYGDLECGRRIEDMSAALLVCYSWGRSAAKFR